ncbi:MAG: methyltransferase domain-containing protein [Saprospiraceae bacterium]|nr:methyltransferase domain-containing protein [Saprospiraceae bacterium]
MSNLPFGHQKFDFIYSISVINYTDDFQSTLSKWMNLLKPEGLFLYQDIINILFIVS